MGIRLNSVAPPAIPENRFVFAAAIARNAEAGRKSDRTRARLQEAACALLDAGTPADIKVADICTEAGVAHGTFYLYFNDIRHLMADTLTAFVGFMQHSMRRAARDQGDDRVRGSTAAYVSLFERNAGLMRCLVSRMDDFPEAAEAFQKLNREWTETVVDARLRQPTLQGCPPPPSREELLRRAYALGGMVDQYLIMLLFGRDPVLTGVSADREAVVDTLTLIWKRGMEP